MAHFAELDESNIVQRVIVVSNDNILDENGNESEQKGIDFCTNLLGGHWIQTSYNKKFRIHFAGEGFFYDKQKDAFIPPKHIENWILDETRLVWIPPIPYPSDGNCYKWDYEINAWVMCDVIAPLV